jgi:hypothetical protein
LTELFLLIRHISSENKFKVLETMAEISWWWREWRSPKLQVIPFELKRSFFWEDFIAILGNVQFAIMCKYKQNYCSHRKCAREWTQINLGRMQRNRWMTTWRITSQNGPFFRARIWI